MYRLDAGVINHHDWAKVNEIHAEANCIANAARFGIATDGASLVVTTEPCATCALLIVSAGIKEVVYADCYDRAAGEGTGILERNGIKVTHSTGE
jgi:dCMP deaminase